MKPQLTQKEMKKMIEHGKTMIWQYKTLYQIDYCRNLGNGEYYLRKITQLPKTYGFGVTERGRYIPMNPEYAASFLQ